MSSSFGSSVLAALTPRRASTRRLLTSSAFFVTFCAAIVTVSITGSSGALPCPARAGRTHAGLAADEGDESEMSMRSAAGLGEKVKLTRRGGWIEIEHPPRKAAANS